MDVLKGSAAVCASLYLTWQVWRSLKDSSPAASSSGWEHDSSGNPRLLDELQRRLSSSKLDAERARTELQQVRAGLEASLEEREEELQQVKAALDGAATATGDAGDEGASVGAGDEGQSDVGGVQAEMERLYDSLADMHERLREKETELDDMKDDLDTAQTREGKLTTALAELAGREESHVDASRNLENRLYQKEEQVGEICSELDVLLADEDRYGGLDSPSKDTANSQDNTNTKKGGLSGVRKLLALKEQETDMLHEQVRMLRVESQRLSEELIEHKAEKVARLTASLKKDRKK